MTTRYLGRWLLVALAIVGLAIATPAVSAHGDEPVETNETAADEMPGTDATDDWATWMDSHMSDSAGPHADDRTVTHGHEGSDATGHLHQDETNHAAGANERMRGGGMMGGGWLFDGGMGLWTLVWLGLILAVPLAIIYRLRERASQGNGTRAETVLRERYARGELTDDEFEQRRRQLERSR